MVVVLLRERFAQEVGVAVTGGADVAGGMDEAWQRVLDGLNDSGPVVDPRDRELRASLGLSA